jgi:hypothetical protein
MATKARPKKPVSHTWEVRLPNGEGTLVVADSLKIVDGGALTFTGSQGLIIAFSPIGWLQVGKA